MTLLALIKAIWYPDFMELLHIANKSPAWSLDGSCQLQMETVIKYNINIEQNTCHSNNYIDMKDDLNRFYLFDK